MPGEVIVQFRHTLSPQSLTTVKVAGLELQLVKPLSAVSARLYRTESASEAQTLALVEALKRRSDVAHAQPNYLLYPLGIPNDPHFALQWHFPAINLPQAWDITTGSSSTVVAVLDTGILFDPADASRSHPDFDPSRILPGYDFVTDPSPIGANDGDGRDPDPYDAGTAATSGYHGTHVAGTIGAWSNNSDVGGVAGIDWHARLLPVRVTGLQSGTTFDFLDGLWWAAGGRVEGVPDNLTPADVINASLGGAAPCDPIVQEVFDILAASGIIVVLAAGNENQDANNSLPANCANVITVGATDVNGTRAFYSNYGSRVHLMAPGGDMRYDVNGDGLPDGVLSPGKDDVDGAFVYTYYQGTSMAAPHVAGLLALMTALDPTLDSADSLAILQATARPLADAACHTEGPGATEPDRILRGADCGAGLVDAHAALLAIAGAPPQPTDVAGTLVQICLPINALECDALRSREVLVDASGTFNASGLSSGAYEIYAWKDVNGNGAVDAGDYFGTHLDSGGHVALVRPPASGLTIELELLTETAGLPAAIGGAGLRKLETLR